MNRRDMPLHQALGRPGSDGAGRRAGLLARLADEDRPADVIHRVIHEPAPRKATLQPGEVDLATEMTPDDDDQMAKLPGMTVPSCGSFVGVLSHL